jgi:hypothetical protein
VGANVPSGVSAAYPDSRSDGSGRRRIFTFSVGFAKLGLDAEFAFASEPDEEKDDNHGKDTEADKSCGYCIHRFSSCKVSGPAFEVSRANDWEEYALLCRK